MTSKPSPGDGNCLFRAINRGVCQFRACPDHVILRRQCVEAIQQIPELYNRFGFPEDLRTFTNDMSQDGHYGDEICIHALAIVLQLYIEVFLPEHPVQLFGSPNNPVIKLAYNGADHFDVIIPNHAFRHMVPAVPKLADKPDPGNQSGKKFVIISSNVTSLRKNWTILKQLPADIYCCQETTLNAAGQNSMKRTLARDKFHALLGPPSKYKFSGSQRAISLWNAGSGGLATIAKLHQPMKNISSNGDPFTIGKCTVTWVPLGMGRRGLYLYNIYGFVGAGPRNKTAFEKNDLLIQQIFEHAASLGDVPILLVGDFQTNPAESKILGSLISNGSYHDLGALLSDAAWTYQKGQDTSIRTRIDLALCNNIMMPLINNLEILDGVGLPAHRPIKISLSFAPHHDVKFVYRSPKPFPVCEPTPESKVVIDQEVWQPMLDTWNEQLRSLPNSSDLQNSINSLFTTWSSTAEDVLLKLASVEGASFHGRGAFPTLINKHVAAPPANEQLGAATIRLLSLLKLNRRMQQLLRKDFQIPDESVGFSQLSRLQRKCEISWQRLLPNETAPDFAHKQCILDASCFLETHIREAQVTITTDRIQTFKERLIADWQATKKATYRWLRDAEPNMVPIFQTDIHEYAVRHRELHQHMYDAWFPIFNRFAQEPEPSFRDFLEKFPHCLPTEFEFSAQRPFVVRDITEEQVSATIHQMKPSAPGADAWRVHELQMLSCFSIQTLAQLLNAVETTGTWPEQLQEIPVAALKKGSGATAKDVRPISLASLIYRLWAKIRWADLQPWHLAWLPPELKGGAKHREAIDAYYELMLEVENSAHSKHPLYGILYDYTKCFDYVPWSIENGLLCALGMPDRISMPLFAFSRKIVRRFKFGNSMGPAIPNTNSIMQGDPLAILRINALIAAWTRVINTTGLCRISAFIDDKNMRSASLSGLQAGIDLTADFDRAIAAEVNSNKTVLFANSPQNILAVQTVTLNGNSLQVVRNDRLLGGHMCFTAKRAVWLANQRAQRFLETAKRISLCPLSVDARAMLLATAAATKYTFGLELGACHIHVERALRSQVLSAIWSKRQKKCVDIVLSLCFKGHNFDPVQLKLFWPFKIARRQLRKHDHFRALWTHNWLLSLDKRQAQHARSQFSGPLAVMQAAVNTLSLRWTSPFEFEFQFDQERVIILHLLSGDDAYFGHIFRFIINQFLWKRASQRKAFASVRIGVDKPTTIKLLNSKSLAEYDRGILRSILSDAITTQKHLYQNKHVDCPTCPFCWSDIEDVEHLFWSCPRWASIRAEFLTPHQLLSIHELPISIRRCGVYPLSDAQINYIRDSHANLQFQPKDWPVEPCVFAQPLQLAMIHIVKARNVAEPLDMPDGFQWFDPRPAVAQRQQDDPKSSKSAATALPAVISTHDENGFLLSTSARPGGSKYQYVRKVKDVYRVVLPVDGKRHNFGPYHSESAAAEKVKQFLAQVKEGTAALTRGQKRTEKFDTSLQEQLETLNRTAELEKRHLVTFEAKVKCVFCETSVHKYHAIKFANRLCHKLTDLVDRKGSHTRAQTSSNTRKGVFSSQVQNHNLMAVENFLHFLINADTNPECRYCGKIFKKSQIKTAMGQRCPFQHSVDTTAPNPPVRRRLVGKQPAS